MGDIRDVYIHTATGYSAGVTEPVAGGGDTQGMYYPY